MSEERHNCEEELTDMDAIRGVLMYASAFGLTLDAVIQATWIDDCRTIEDFDTAIDATIKLRGACGK